VSAEAGAKAAAAGEEGFECSGVALPELLLDPLGTRLVGGVRMPDPSKRCVGGYFCARKECKVATRGG